MNKSLLTLAALFISFYMIVPIANGRDREGCLTCHQYPGLVQSEKGDQLKILHIDEKKYAQSPHKGVACRQCHVGLNKVPHAAENHVECNNKCHVSQKDKQMIKNYDFKSLHSKEQSYIRKNNDHTYCHACHPLYPHYGNNLVRAFMNMHTGFMFCETCHIDNKKFGDLNYEWISSRNIKFIGDPFGSYFKPNFDQKRRKRNVISRISVYHTLEGKKESLTNTADTRKAQLFLQAQRKMGEKVRKRELDYFHKDVAKKEVSVACNGCHSINGIMDFKKLGFDEKKTDHLAKINLKGLVDKYKTFYFPNLFSR